MNYCFAHSFNKKFVIVLLAHPTLISVYSKVSDSNQKEMRLRKGHWKSHEKYKQCKHWETISNIQW